MIKEYYYLAKPGIIYGNAITAIAGFLFASKGELDWQLFLAMLVGISLVMSAGCVFNNIHDRAFDAKMDRTKNRALVTGKISKRAAIIYGILLLVLGFTALYYHTNNTATLTALAGFLVYVMIYTPLKHQTVVATLLGSIAGAVPPVVGYTAMTNDFNKNAWLLFLILICWQMPHFYAIGIRRLEDYKNAHTPILPAVSGIQFTKYNMLFFIISFTAFCYLLLPITAVLGVVWLILVVSKLKPQDYSTDQLWAKRMFLTSLVILLLFSLTISINGIMNL